MKIAFINDFHFAGGAEITSRYFIESLASNGHSVCIILCDELSKIGDVGSTDYDLFILNNIRKAKWDDILRIITNEPYIYFPRDVLDLPKEISDHIKEIYENSYNNIFLSPLHKNTFITKYGLVESDKNILYMPYFDVDSYYQGNNRKELACWLGNFYYHKGIDNCLLWARGHSTKIKFYGKGGDPIIKGQIEHSKYGELMGSIDSKNVSDMLSSYQYFIHLPNEVEAFGRGAAEAMLSGCELIADKEKIGFFSYNFRDREDFVTRMEKSQNDILSFINMSIKV